MARLTSTILLAAAMAVAGGASAGPVTPQKAAAVARTFWSGAVNTKKGATLEAQPVEWQYNGIYLFACPEGGWVMVAADDEVKPILGYSPSGRLDPADMPVALQQWLGGYQLQIDAVRSYRQASGDKVPAYPADAAEWQRLTAGIVAEPAKSDTVAPLLTTLWDQDYPYNALCPSGTVTGCAATAQAQLMKFWNYPAFGEGSNTYVPPRVGVAQTADFGHTLYDWDNMPDNPSYYATTDQIKAVATLMYHCGVSLDMDYGTAESGGSAALGLVGYDGYASIDNALKNYFHYSHNMQVRHKDYYSNEAWRAMLVNELNLRHPILYTGAAEQGGHGFVCDGYDSRQYLHFNFGWNGVGDGFFTVDSISPGVGGIGGNVTYTFNLQNAALFGAVPDYALRISDTMFSFGQAAGTDSLLYCSNESNDIAWTVSCDVDWIEFEQPSPGHAGWLRFNVSENNDGNERVGHIIFRQGNEEVRAKIAQASLSEDEMCTLTVVMESTRGSGWSNGAYLSLESANGYVYGTARLESGTLDSVDIRVAPKDVYSVWHSGGGTDRFINYWVRNQYGENFVEAEYAYQTGGTHLIAWPCAHVGIEEPAEGSDSRSVELYPVPTSGKLTVRAEGLQKVDILDIGGRTIVSSTVATLDLSYLPNGMYFVRVTTTSGSSVQRIVKK
ncbi:MAG: C10 family peptidase [Bacteroidales bacterium]|nr:C10 family peptidase [Bacteroidales bacterium]